ncbi:MAG: type IV pili methyl-accepting chemotaxis transducer N-terminal domain-containing protein, partial [Pontibacterium sp.]
MANAIAGLLDKSLRMVGLKTIDSQFTFSYILIFIFASVSVLEIFLALSNDANTINVAGRQRMLSQRLAKEVMLVERGVEDRATLDKTINLFESSHQNLLSGNDEAKISKPANDEIIA